VSALARAEYGLHRLIADAAVSNMASRAVLRRTGFVPIGDVMVAGQPSIRHVLDLSNATPSEALLPRPQ
jgi:ribosomal-protein-alanine N-acetyltransferase